MKRKILSLLGVVLAFVVPGFGAGETPFASDIAPTFTHSENYDEKTNDDCDFIVQSSGGFSSAPIKIDFSVSLTGVNTGAFNAATPYSFSFGNLSFSGVLGDDPQFGPGKKSAKIGIETDFGQPEVGGVDTGIGGQITIDWSDGDVVRVEIRFRNVTEDYFPIAFDFLDEVFADEDTPNPDAAEIPADTALAVFILGDRIFSREIFYEGTADAAYSGITCEESLDRIDIQGMISQPVVAIDTPAEGSESLVPFPTISGSATNIDLSEIVEVVVTGENDQEDTAVLVGPVPIVPPPSEGPVEQWLWTVDFIKLRPGRNTITVVAIDDAGVPSVPVKRVINYPTMSAVTVTLQGEGTISNGFPGTKSFATGSMLTLDAKPTPGWLFAGWGGDEVEASPRLRFEVLPLTDLTATFVPGPFLDVLGSYAGGGAFADGPPGTPVGVKVTVSVLGTLTGQLFIGGQRYGFRGKFDAAGEFVASIARKGQPDVTVALSADTNNFQDLLDAEVSSDGENAMFAARRGEAANPQVIEGTYTAAILRNTDPPFDTAEFPAGHGYATLKVDGDGDARVVGRLPDGSRFSGACRVDAADGLFFHVFPHLRSGWFSGRLLFQDVPGESDADGVFAWHRPAGRRYGRAYQEGFTTEVEMIAARFTPVTGARVFPNNAASGTVTAGDVAGDFFTNNVAIAGDNTVTPSPAPENLRVRINSRTGMFGGSFVGPDEVLRRFQGAVLQKANRGFGHFPAGEETGSVDFVSGP